MNRPLHRRYLIAATLAVFARPVAGVTLTWDATGAAASNPVDGRGTWNTSAARWSNGSADVPWPNDSSTAVFGNNHGTGGVVTVGVPVSAGGVTFDPAGSGQYTIAGTSAVTLIGTTPTITANGTSPVVSAPLAGTAGLTVAGSGTLNLSGADAYTGGTRVNGGTLVLAGPTSLGGGPLTVATGATAVVAAAVVPNAVVTNSGTFDLSAGVIFDAGFYGFNQAAGVLNLAGSFNAGGFVDVGGTINGVVPFNNSGSITFGPSAAAATFNVSSQQFAPGITSVYGTTPAMNVPAGAVVNATANRADTRLTINTPANYGTINVITAASYTSKVTLPAAGFTNHGTITLSVTGGTTVLASNFSTGFVNGADGVVNCDIPVGVLATPSNTQIVNYGSFTVAAGQPFNTASTYTFRFNQSGGTLTTNNAFYVQSFYDSGGVVTGAVSLPTGGSLTFGPGATPLTATFTSTGGHIYGSDVPAGSSVVVRITARSAAVGLYAARNYGLIDVQPGSFGSTVQAATLVNHGTMVLESGGQIDRLNNGADGLIQCYSNNISGGLVNAGQFNVSAGYTVSVGTLNVSGGIVRLADSTGTGQPPAAIQIGAVYWPTTSAVNGSSIITTAVTGAATAGVVDLNGSSAVSFYLGYAPGVLTVTANLVDGGINKSGPGTLVLTGANTYEGPTVVAGGTLTLPVGGSLATSSVTVAAGAVFNASGSAARSTLVYQGGTVVFPAGNGSSPHVVTAGPISVAAGSTGVLAAASNHAGRAVLVVPSLTCSGVVGGWTSGFDLTNNDMVVTAGDLATLVDQARQGELGPTGLTSSTALGDTGRRFAVAVVPDALAGFTAARPFDGVIPGPADVLVKYTYFGDANLDGKVDGSDYSLIDNGYTSHGGLTGWYSGDFNYDGATDGSDYTLIDSAFNRQTASLSPTALVAGTAAVPEPAVAVAVLFALPRRRARSRRLT